MVRADVPVPPAVNETGFVLNDVVSPVTGDGVDAVRLMLPAKPRLFRAMVEVAEVPAGRLAGVAGPVVTVKSAVTVRVTFAEWDNVPSLALLLVPVTVMM